MSTPSPSKKRPHDTDEGMVAMAMPKLISEDKDWLTKDPDACIQDGGASTFLLGSEYLIRYMSAGLSRLAIQLRQFHSSDVTRTSSLGAMQRATVAGWLNFQSTWVVPLDAANAS